MRRKLGKDPPAPHHHSLSQSTSGPTTRGLEGAQHAFVWAGGVLQASVAFRQPVRSPPSLAVSLLGDLALQRRSEE